MTQTMKESTLETARRFEPRNFEALYGMAGFSEAMLSEHFKLYEGYVKSTNSLMELLTPRTKDPEVNPDALREARRRFAWEFNGMRLHELYFGNLGGGGLLDSRHPLHRLISDQFGSFEAWKEDFTEVGAMRGVGWAVLCRDAAGGKLFNVWVEQHHAGHLAGARPLLVLDAFEHAHLRDYGIDRRKYIQSFHGNVNWEAVTGRAADAGLPHAS